MKHYYCSDENPKIVTRIYNWDGKQVKFILCAQHRKDPDFSNFTEEIPLVEVMEH